MTDYPKNEQEIFDRVWQHFVVEKNPLGCDEGGMCAYRGDGGAKCAVGLFIPDALYNPNFEGYKLSSLLRMLSRESDPATCKVFQWMDEHRDLLAELQLAHDVAARGERSIEEALRDLAWKCELQVPS